MRFIQGRKVREIAPRMAMSESDLYRKQKIAVEAVAASLSKMEERAVETDEAMPGPVAIERSEEAETLRV
jgi:hypothetical protein